MPARLSFDDRLWNPYAVENLEHSHPGLHGHLRKWFTAIGDFDDTSLLRLVNAKGADEVAKWHEKGSAALEAARHVALTLEPVTKALEQALAGSAPFPERQQLEDLLEAARRNRAALLEQAPALAAEALGSASGYADVKAAATKAVDETARRLEAMRERASGSPAPYRELQPVVDELRETWSALDRALAPLSRQDQRAVRDPMQERMAAAARTLCRALFLAKTRDRASGAFPMPGIAAPGDGVAERLAAAVARRDLAGAAATLAPWLRDAWTAGRLGEALDRSAAEIAAGFGLDVPPPPGDWHAGANPMTYEDVRARERTEAPVPAEVTTQNFVAWHVIEIRTEEEDEYLTDIGFLLTLYAISVRTPEGERIGYLALAE